MITEVSRGGDAGPDTELSEALSDERRHHVLAVLRNAGGLVSLTALARDVAERERSGEAAPLRDAALQRYRASLYHCHLPKLADLALVDFDADRECAALADGVRVES